MDEAQTTTLEQSQSQSTPVVKFAQNKGKFSKIVPILVILFIIIAGVFSGLVLSSRDKVQKQQTVAGKDEETDPQVQEAFAQTFKDEAEGTIQKNDALDKYAQGTHKLIRAGGESQTAYLTSSVLDLNQYIGKKVKVFGETFGSSQVGWLMDVGKVEEMQ